jgi:hypothetical protein
MVRFSVRIPAFPGSDMLDSPLDKISPLQPRSLEKAGAVFA